MRPYTIALSIAVHVIAAGAAVITPLLATDELPAPRTATEFIQVIATPVPPPPPPPRVAAARRVETPRADVPPLAVPDGIAPESVVAPPVDAAPVDGGLINFGTGNSGLMDAVPPPPPPPPREAIRPGGKIRAPQKIADVAPVYPPLARIAHVEGVVILEAVIAEDGTVRDLRVLRSINLLDDAAMEAVRQWRFTPTLLNGEPVPVVMTVTVAFKLR
jgi:protein TonB